MANKTWRLMRGTYGWTWFILPTIELSLDGICNEIVISWLKFYVGIYWRGKKNPYTDGQ